MFKLLGHKEEITQLAQFKFSDKQERSVLVSSSKDGFLKLWDLQQQFCLHTFADANSAKIHDFVLVPELQLVVVGTNEGQYLHVYEIVLNGKVPELKTHSKLKKESNQRVLEMHYDF